MRDPWAEQPPPPAPRDARAIVAVIMHTGTHGHYTVEDLRRAFMATRDEHARRCIRTAADVLLAREAVPAA